MHNLLRKASQVSLSEKSGRAQRNLQAPLTQVVPENSNAFKGGAPSPSAPPHIPSSNAIPRNILAFRTITTLLSKIRRGVFQTSNPNARLRDNERLELKLSDAISTVAVIEDEVVAVATKRSPDQRFEIVVCTQPSKNKNTLNMPSPSSKLVSQVWHLLMTQTHGESDPQESVLEPIISDVLANLDLVDDDTLNMHVEEHRSHSTVARHLWIVHKLLTMKGRSTDGKTNQEINHDHLARYIIAACYPKMIRRINNKTLSQPYIESLKQIKTFRFRESLRDQSSSSEDQADRLFLVGIVLQLAGGPALDISVPKLTEQAKLAMNDKPFQLYTEETSAEFHGFLVKLLEHFQRYLNELPNLQGAEKAATQGSGEFRKCVDSVSACAAALRLLSASAALKMHLKTIQALLWYGDHYWDNQEELWPIRPFVSADGVEEDIDEELKAVRPHMMAGRAVKPLWMAYFDWLKLMVAPFDAAGHLAANVTGPRFQHQTVSMQIIDAPPVDQDLLPWRELFIDPTLFPTETAMSEFSSFKSDGGITNTGIIEFLDKAIESSSEAKTVKESWNKKDIEHTITIFEKIQDSNFLGWRKRAQKQLVKLRKLNGPPDDTLSREISEAIGSLCDSAKFFHFMGEVRGFSGTMHCEACLASLLDETTTASESPLKQMEDFRPVIGIAQRSSCPICQHLFSLLAKHRRQLFIVTRSHNAITPCTLPTWLPADVVDSMNEFFGAQLRQELVKLIDRSELSRRYGSLEEEDSDDYVLTVPKWKTTNV